MKTSGIRFKSVERIARSRAFGTLVVGALVVIFWLVGPVSQTWPIA